MMTATDEFPDLIRAGELTDASDAGLFALVDELKEREKDRNDLLDRLSIEEGDQIDAAAKKACDAARAIYERIAAMKPTTAAGVLCQLELAASGWRHPHACKEFLPHHGRFSPRRQATSSAQEVHALFRRVDAHCAFNVFIADSESCRGYRVSSFRIRPSLLMEGGPAS
jgi:hypothetical protein